MPGREERRTKVDRYSPVDAAYLAGIELGSQLSQPEPKKHRRSTIRRRITMLFQSGDAAYTEEDITTDEELD